MRYNYPIHIGILVCISIFLIGVYYAAKEHSRKSLVSNEPDYITKLLQRKEQELIESSVKLSMDNYILLIAAGFVLLGSGVFVYSKNGIISIIFAFIGIGIPDLIISFLKKRNTKMFEERYVRALEQLASSLKAGMSISQAVQDVANCPFVHPTLRNEFQQMNADIQMGLDVGEAFRNFADRTHNKDAMDVALAIDIQNEVGGREAESIKSIVDNIQKRIMLRREIDTIFSSTTSMVYIMDVIPIGVMTLFSATNKDFIEIYFSSPGYIVLFILLFIMPIFGSVIVHKKLKKIKKGV